MRILWFSINPSLYFGNSTMGSWVEALERIIRKRTDCELAVAFAADRPLPQKTDGNVTYFPVHFPRSRFQHRYIDDYTSKYTDAFLIEEGLRIINDYKPDIIQCFGTEWPYGLLAEHTQTPIVIHLQGLWFASKNVISEQDSTKTIWDYMKEEHRPQMWLSFMRKQHKAKERAERELRILKVNKHFLYRTRWDKAIAGLCSPEAQFHYCSEALRDAFVTAGKRWQLGTQKRCRLITVGNSDMAKGYPLIIKTAEILKTHTNFEFEWTLVGIWDADFKYLKNKYKIDHKKVGLKPIGSQCAEDIAERMLESDIFMQTSITDNSPNAMCEAQYMGMPIIATCVGGVPSLFDKDYDSDLLVPLHDPYYLAAKIIELFEDKPRMQRLANMNYNISHERHDDKAIEKDLFACYESIIRN